MQCPVCSLPEEWHDDGWCPTYRQAADILFAPPEPSDLREFSDDSGKRVKIGRLPGFSDWVMYTHYIDANGEHAHDVLDTFRTRREAESALVAQALHR